MPHSPSRLAPPLAALAVAAGLALAAGCGGGSAYTAESTSIARSFLPAERELAHHPDTLAHLSIGQEDGHVVFEMDESYRGLIRRWSSTWQSTRGRGRAQRSYYHSYATLWSKELSLASLQPERGVQSLSLDLAERLIDERLENYRQTLQIDVYRYLRSPYTSGDLSSLRLTGPGRDVYLEDDRGNTYPPQRIEAGRLEQAYLPGGGAALYERNVILFPRRVEGRDILEGIRWLRLVVREAATIDYYFTWIFPREPSTP